MKRARRLMRHVVMFGLVMLLWALPTQPQSSRYGNRLTVHVEDAIGAPGGRVAIVLRAYASRPIGQGQICFMAQAPEPDPGPDAEPSLLLSYTDSVVFSSAGDVQIEFVEMTEDPPRYVLRFVSPSATVNDYHGPMAVVFFDLHENAVPGSRFELVVDAQDTEFLDENGYPIEFELTPGELSVRAAAAPYMVAADVGTVARGDVAEIGVRTAEPVAWARGRIGLRWDVDVLPDEPVVRMDPRHGLSSFEYDVPYPGLLIVDFASPDASLNRVPGRVILVNLNSSRAARPRASTRIWIDPALSWIIGSAGQPLPLALADDHIELLPPSGRSTVSPYGRPSARSGN